MWCKATSMVLGIIALGLLLSPNSATALVAGELQDLRIISHHFTTSISTRKRRIFTKDPSDGRYLVLKLAATAPKATTLFAPDFVLAYSYKGREERADCDAIATAETAAPGDIDRFRAGSVPRIKVHRGESYFGLAFWIETDVTTIEIHRIGAKPITYRIGDDRLYSVFISTNIDLSFAEEAKKILQEGSYNVVNISDRLAKKKDKTIINYAETAENQARDISQRLMLKLGVVPTLKKMQLVTDVDIVVWLGEQPSRLPPFQVRRVQESLSAAGYNPGPVDGFLGSQTRAALRQYQQAHGLPLTGEPDEATLDALGVR